MEKAEDVGVAFYEVMGRLFYAIVASDGVVTASEQKCLKRMVCSHWVCIEEVKDKFCSCKPTEIIHAFEYALFKRLRCDACFNEYLSFKNENPELFAPVVKKLIWTTANVIVHAFPGLNRSEAQMLIRLQESLEA
ncbi:MAG: hypothetical protein CL868_16925 [Cytophagaceae bacterium]|nr:hypothetical protein [Cytophagaceae bacterium]|tara:strand:+ start:237 stop:641 length:405 start_codon:yes stop_codon:yes gene_type:complete